MQFVQLLSAEYWSIYNNTILLFEIVEYGIDYINIVSLASRALPFSGMRESLAGYLIIKEIFMCTVFIINHE